MEVATKKRLARIREIGAARSEDKLDFKAINEELDTIWQYLEKNKPRTLPIVEREIERELAQSKPNSFLLLDAGFWLILNQKRDLAVRALFALDTADRVVRNSNTTLFHYAHAVAGLGDARVEPLLDRFFLNTDRPVFVPQHVLNLDPTLQGVFLYGALSPTSETHVAELLEKPFAPKARVLEILSWIGSEMSVASVVAALGPKTDRETYLRAAAFFLRVGGPRGRDTLNHFDVAAVPQQARPEHEKLKAAASEISYEKLLAELEKNFEGPKRLSDAEIKKRLRRMRDAPGSDTDTHPAAVAASSLPKQFLLDELRHIRHRTLHFVSDEALAHVEVTNFVFNTVQFR